MPSAQSLALRARNGTPGIQSLESLRRHPHRVWCAEAPASGSRTGGSLTRSPISPTPHQHDTDTDTDNGGHPPQEAPRYRYPHRDGTCSRWDKGPGIALLQQAGIQQKSTKNCRPRPAAQGTHGTPKKKKKVVPQLVGAVDARTPPIVPSHRCLPACLASEDPPGGEKRGGGNTACRAQLACEVARQTSRRQLAIYSAPAAPPTRGHDSIPKRSYTSYLLR